jgi:DNA modification methylase
VASWRIIEGDCREVLATLPDESVQCCITSPPYLGQRDYGIDAQIGLEQTLEEYVAAIVATFAEVWRVLRDDGTLWLNLGDTYGGHTSGAPQSAVSERSTLRGNGHVGGGPKLRGAQVPRRRAVGRPKDLLGIPWRVAFALQAGGWFIRQENIWAKRNLKPESATDRPTRAHEQVFLLSKRARYFYDAEAISEAIDPAQAEHNQRYAKVYDAHTQRMDAGHGQPGNVNDVGIHSRRGGDRRNKRSVWTISTVPLSEDHSAAFPPKLAEPCTLAGSRPGDTILDPFAGAGTTGLVALRHGRSFVGVELNPGYVEMARRRIIDDAPLLNQWCEDPTPLTSKDETAPPSSSLTAGNEAA